MCCCKCPIPFPGTIYLFFNILFGFYFYTPQGFMFVNHNTTEVEILNASKCEGIDDRDLVIQLEINQDNQTISGNITLNVVLDESVKVTFKESERKIYSTGKSLCKLVNTYYYNNGDVHGEFLPCPVSPGSYKFSQLVTPLTFINIPKDMMGEKVFRVELIRNGETLACRNLHLRNRVKLIEVVVDE